MVARSVKIMRASPSPSWLRAEFATQRNKIPGLVLDDILISLYKDGVKRLQVILPLRKSASFLGGARLLGQEDKMNPSTALQPENSVRYGLGIVCLATLGVL